jgi:integrase
MLDTLKMIMRSAKERGQRVDEAVFRVRPPRRERAEMRFLDWNEVERLALETVEPYGNLVRFACLTGLRQGEPFALRDRALDLPRRTLVVEAGAREGKLVPTKTAAGQRQVSLSSASSASSSSRARRTSLGLPSRRRMEASGARTTSWRASSVLRFAAPSSRRFAFTISATPTPH